MISSFLRKKRQTIPIAYFARFLLLPEPPIVSRRSSTITDRLAKPLTQLPATVVITLGLLLVGSLSSLLSSPPPGTVRIVRSWCLSLVRRLRNGVSAHPPTWLIGFPIIQRGRYSVEFYEVVQCTERFTSRWYCLLEKQKPDIKAIRMSDPVALNVRLRSLGRVLSWSLALAAMRKPYPNTFR